MRAIRRAKPANSGAQRAALLVLLCLLVLGVLLLVGMWEGAWPAARQRRESAEHYAECPERCLREPGAAAAGTAAAAVAAAAALIAAPPPPPRLRKGEPTADTRERCQGTLGAWCSDYHSQIEVAAVAAPRGNKTCSMDCNKVGTCNALSGLCTCPAGWMGFNCLHPMKRHCTHSYRQFGFEVPRLPPNLTLGVAAGDNKGVTSYPRTHCAGYCDDDIAACFCPTNTTYGRKPAPPEAPQGSPPLQRGRPMGMWCQPSKLPDGRDTAWGTVHPDELWGRDGWCNAAQPKQQCECYLDGFGGKNCDEPYEQFCFSQCNGRGECKGGYCKCHPGWHGIDCAHSSTSSGGGDTQRPGLEATRPWIAPHIHAPAAVAFPPEATRKLPLIYVYELPAEYSTLMVQYRFGGEQCVPRYYKPGNESVLSGWVYNLEPGLLEMLLQSEHRTLDPEEADFFYVPVFTSCFIYPVRNAADSLRDFYYGVWHNRVQGATNMMLEAYHWLKGHHPYWDRRDGRDHIWLVTHDEGSCWVPAAIRSSIILSHWGRMDANHTSDTGYHTDVYSKEMFHPQWEPDGYLRKIKGHACYHPVKDLVVPLMKTPDHYHASPMIGGITRNRTWLAFHRGRVQFENPAYSRGIRQRIARAAEEGGWLEKHRMAVGDYQNITGDYSELLAASVFCLVLPGDGWSARMDDATLHGCIPVIIMDNVHVSFESVVDLSAFTLRIPQADVERLPDILLAVPQGRVEEMQRAMALVWHRFTYSSYRPYAKRFLEIQATNRAAAAALSASAAAAAEQAGTRSRGSRSSQASSLPETVASLDPLPNDAFCSIMAWLYSRIEATR